MDKSDAWYVYDGECPLCRTAASYYRLKRSVGRLHLIDARAERDHPVLKEIYAAGLDLDEGMVIKYQNRLYHGQEALYLMGSLAAEDGWFNRLIRSLSLSSRSTRISYPVLKALRNAMLKINGTGKIENTDL